MKNKVIIEFTYGRFLVGETIDRSRGGLITCLQKNFNLVKKMLSGTPTNLNKDVLKWEGDFLNVGPYAAAYFDNDFEKNELDCPKCDGACWNAIFEEIVL